MRVFWMMVFLKTEKIFKVLFLIITIGVSESNLRMSYRLLDSDPENKINLFSDRLRKTPN